MKILFKLLSDQDISLLFILEKCLVMKLVIHFCTKIAINKNEVSKIKP